MIQATLAQQLLALGLDALTVKDSEPGAAMPPDDALCHVVSAAWNELFSVFADTPLERPAEDLAWNFVNIFHRAAERQERRIDEATDRIRLMLADADVSEIGTHDLEETIDRARETQAIMQAFQTMREQAAMLYNAETTHSWRPFRGGRAAPGVTAAIVDGRSFLKARADSRRQQALPPGTPVVFSGGRIAVSDGDAQAFADNLFRTLERVRERVGDMILVHGGDSKGVDRFAAGWAERHRIPQVVFGLDPKLGQKAGFRRNEQMLGLKPRYVIALPGQRRPGTLGHRRQAAPDPGCRSPWTAGDAAGGDRRGGTLIPEPVPACRHRLARLLCRQPRKVRGSRYPDRGPQQRVARRFHTRRRSCVAPFTMTVSSACEITLRRKPHSTFGSPIANRQRPLRHAEPRRHRVEQQRAAIIESCLQRILLPDARAIEPQIRKACERV